MATDKSTSQEQKIINELCPKWEHYWKRVLPNRTTVAKPTVVKFLTSLVDLALKALQRHVSLAKNDQLSSLSTVLNAQWLRTENYVLYQYRPTDALNEADVVKHERFIHLYLSHVLYQALESSFQKAMLSWSTDFKGAKELFHKHLGIHEAAPAVTDLPFTYMCRKLVEYCMPTGGTDCDLLSNLRTLLVSTSAGASAIVQQERQLAFTLTNFGADSQTVGRIVRAWRMDTMHQSEDPTIQQVTQIAMEAKRTSHTQSKINLQYVL